MPITRALLYYHLRQLVEEVRVSSLDLVAEGGAAVRHQRVQGQPSLGQREVHCLRRHVRHV